MKKLLVDPETYFSDIRRHKNIIMFGGGSKAHQVIALLEDWNIFPCEICDNNKELQGQKFMEKYVIKSYEKIKKEYDSYCIIITTTITNAISIKEGLIKAGEKNPIYHVCNFFKVDEEFLEYENVINEEKYKKAYDLLEDEVSKRIFIKNVNSKMTGNGLELYDEMTGNSFFDEELLGKSVTDVYVDVGAYTGDTLLQFLKFCRGKYHKIYAFEPDQGNYLSLQKFIKYGVIENVETFNIGGWSEAGEREFFSASNNENVNYDSPNLFRDISRAITKKEVEQCKKENAVATSYIVRLDSVDNIVTDHEASIIKINALAADFPILVGCKETILKSRPVIIMEYGARPEYMTEELTWLAELKVGYKFYMRQKSIFGDCKTLLYAICDREETNLNE